MKLTKERGTRRRAPVTSYKFSSTALEALKTFKVEVSETREERIVVVDV